MLDTTRPTYYRAVSSIKPFWLGNSETSCRADGGFQLPYNTKQPGKLHGLTLEAFEQQVKQQHFSTFSIESFN